MPEEKGLGSKLLGLFVEVDDKKAAEDADGGEKSAADLVKELAEQSQAPAPAGAPSAAPAMARPAATPTAAPAPRPPPPSGVTPAKIDFDQVFKGAGVDPQELDRVRKAEELLKGLPEGTPDALKRQIVEASLKAFGIDLQKISQAATNQLKALDTFTRLKEQQTQKTIQDAQAQIAQLEDKVIGLKADIDKRNTELAQTQAAAELRRAEVQRVLGFFLPAPAGSPSP